MGLPPADVYTLNLDVNGSDNGLSNIGGMPLPEPMPTYCEMDLLESTPLKHLKVSRLRLCEMRVLKHCVKNKSLFRTWQ